MPKEKDEVIVDEDVDNKSADTKDEDVVDTADEDKDDASEEKDIKKEEEGEPDQDEERALASGWKPEKEWTGDPKKWVPADEYLRRGELFEKIESQGRELKESKKVLRMLQEHHAKVKETEYKRALDDIKARKKQALIDGDADAVMQADDELIDIKAEAKAAEVSAKQEARRPDPRFVAWVEKNAWYVQDEEMHSFADDIGFAHAKSHPTKTPEEVLLYVESRVKKVYPDKFTNPLRKRPGVVEGNDRTDAVRKSVGDDFELTKEERKVMNTFVSEGVMSKEEYIAEIKAMRGAK